MPFLRPTTGARSAHVAQSPFSPPLSSPVPLCLALLCLALTLVGCVSSPPVVRERVSAPRAPVTVLADTSAADLAIHASRTLFAESSLVVVAAMDDANAQASAAKRAITWGVPLLLVAGRGPAGPSPKQTAQSYSHSTTAIFRELQRLKVHTIATVGRIAPLGQVSATVVAAATIQHTRTTSPPAGGVAVIVSADSRTVAASATASAVGATVQKLAPGAADLQASARAITFLHTNPAQAVLLIGADFASIADPDWSVAAARSGYQLTGGGQRLFPDHRFVAIYGAPGVPSLGVVGEQDAAATVLRARTVAEPFAALSSVPVVPMLELIATVAAGDAGSDGDYSNELPVERLTPFVDAAADAGLYVVLDLQPGRANFLDQAKQYLPLLKRPNVGLALDPEWRLSPDQLPLRQIGSVDASEVNAVAAWLAGVVTAGGLPPKMFVLHQFTSRMIADRASIDTSHPQLEVLVHADGQGSQPAKQATWNALHSNAPSGVSWGWKNFYDEDTPMLTPEQSMSSVVPTPQLFTYQ